jgi:hypothetical protein
MQSHNRRAGTVHHEKDRTNAGHQRTTYRHDGTSETVTRAETHGNGTRYTETTRRAQIDPELNARLGIDPDAVTWHSIHTASHWEADWESPFDNHDIPEQDQPRDDGYTAPACASCGTPATAADLHPEQCADCIADARLEYTTRQAYRVELERREAEFQLAYELLTESQQIEFNPDDDDPTGEDFANSEAAADLADVILEELPPEDVAAYAEIMHHRGNLDHFTQ